MSIVKPRPMRSERRISCSIVVTKKERLYRPVSASKREALSASSRACRWARAAAVAMSAMRTRATAVKPTQASSPGVERAVDRIDDADQGHGGRRQEGDDQGRPTLGREGRAGHDEEEAHEERTPGPARQHREQAQEDDGTEALRGPTPAAQDARRDEVHEEDDEEGADREQRDDGGHLVGPGTRQRPRPRRPRRGTGGRPLVATWRVLVGAMSDAPRRG